MCILSLAHFNLHHFPAHPMSIPPPSLCLLSEVLACRWTQVTVPSPFLPHSLSESCFHLRSDKLWVSVFMCLLLLMIFPLCQKRTRKRKLTISDWLEPSVSPGWARRPRAAWWVGPGLLPCLSGWAGRSQGHQVHLSSIHWCGARQYLGLEVYSTCLLNQCLSFFMYLFIYLAALGLSCGMWDQVPWPRIEPGPPTLVAQSLSPWSPREVPEQPLLDQHQTHRYCSRCCLTPPAGKPRLHICLCVFLLESGSWCTLSTLLTVSVNYDLIGIY